MPAKINPESPEREEYGRFLQILGARIRALRKERGWSYRDMVVSHGFHLSAWQSYESGKYGLSMISLLRVAKVFGMPASELIVGIDPGPPAAELESSASAKAARRTNVTKP